MGFTVDDLVKLPVSCETCPAWDALETQKGKGLCRSNHPFRPDTGTGALWPVTGKEDWCLQGRLATIAISDAVSRYFKKREEGRV